VQLFAVRNWRFVCGGTLSDAKAHEKILHQLVPKHELLGAQEKSELLSKTSISSIPKIHVNDQAIKLFGLEPSLGDIIKISREDVTGKNTYYRVVIK